ncbi:MAG: carbon-nitrogen hydrolase family protein [Actinobacteria bacterium]|nr:carbon-nitrogen hydrolase family protein [Actinomycetota bacterium]MCL5072584.1 carbon-nitrogen hydrolase family protein [Actinomycetota bacterium]
MIDIMKKASNQGADIVVFHEMFFCDYYVRDIREYSEQIPGLTTNIISKKAKEMNIGLIFGIGEISSNKHYNASILIDNHGKIIEKYHKTHLSSVDRDGKIQKETDVFEPGEGYPVFVTSLGCFGMMICKDGFYFEVPLILGLKGCEILFWLVNRYETAKEYAIAISSQIKACLVVCNRAGNGIEGGGSCIIDRGKLLSQAGKEETVIIEDIDLSEIRSSQKHWWKIQHKRRPDTYGEIIK